MKVKRKKVAKQKIARIQVAEIEKEFESLKELRARCARQLHKQRGKIKELREEIEELETGEEEKIKENLLEVASRYYFQRSVFSDMSSNDFKLHTARLYLVNPQELALELL